MTKIKDLIATLKTRNPEAQVFMMTTRKQPFENYLAGVVGREEMLDQQWREELGIAPDDVFLVVGKRIRPGSLSAWIVAEHRADTEQPEVEIPRSDDSSVPMSDDSTARDRASDAEREAEAEAEAQAEPEPEPEAEAQAEPEPEPEPEPEADTDADAEAGVSILDALHEWSNRE